MKSQTPTDTLVPAGLLPGILAAADEERRAPGELVGEAVERYMEDREWKKIFSYGEECAAALGLTQQDIPRLIAEYRQRPRQGQG